MLNGLESQLVTLDESLAREWSAYASKQDRLERILAGDDVADSEAHEVVVAGLKLALRQLQRNRMQRYVKIVEAYEPAEG